MDDQVYISSLDPLEYDRDQQCFVQPQNFPKLLLEDRTPECTKAHGLAITPSNQIAFTDVAARQVKLLSVDGNSITVEVISGSGLDGQSEPRLLLVNQLHVAQK